ncbi:hypothetical protein AX17_005036 [Amanita inopinata Kibby_2008]|nr:hypothetical protein AX17_005036 [Amanita inopinata Kibby_2008]
MLLGVRPPAHLTMRFCTFISTAVAVMPIALAANFDVMVGLNGALSYTPNEVHPNIGDTLTFVFVTGNHTATTTTFTDPCPPPAGGTGPNGFDTGFHLPPDTATITIRDTQPHWVSCRQAAGAHCRAGMTLAINPTADMTEAQFMQNAMDP